MPSERSRFLPPPGERDERMRAEAEHRPLRQLARERSQPKRQQTPRGRSDGKLSRSQKKDARDAAQQSAVMGLFVIQKDELDKLALDDAAKTALAELDSWNETEARRLVDRLAEGEIRNPSKYIASSVRKINEDAQQAEWQEDDATGVAAIVEPEEEEVEADEYSCESEGERAEEPGWSEDEQDGDGIISGLM